MPAVRRRDAARSRKLLLQAAVQLFADRGFDATTVRELGEHAGVDPALIARYYGSKTGLYIAALRDELGAETPPDLLCPGRTAELLDRVDRRGAGPVFRAAVLTQDDPHVADAVTEHLQRRLIGPLRERFERAGLERAQLRAEIALAAFAGIVLGRTAGTLEALASASDDEVLALIDGVLAAVQAP